MSKLQIFLTSRHFQLDILVLPYNREWIFMMFIILSEVIKKPIAVNHPVIITSTVKFITILASMIYKLFVSVSFMMEKGDLRD